MDPQESAPPTLAPAASRSDLRRLRVAAIQVPSRLGAIEENLARAERMAVDAAAQGAALILFHELMPSGYAWDTRAWMGAEPSNGATSRWLAAIAQRLGAWVGTSFLEAADGDFWNTFVLVSPYGQEAGRVRKEFPAMFEARTFRGDPGSHVIETSLGRIGVGICFDAHTASVARRFAAADVELVLAPHCYCVPARTSRTVSAKDIERLRSNIAGLAPLLAGALGVPVITTNRVGPWDADRGSPYVFVGQATIADSSGAVAARLGDAEGIAIGDVTLDPARRTRTPPRAYSRWVYPGPPGRELLRLVEWWAGRQYRRDPDRRRMATTASEGLVDSEGTELRAAPPSTNG